jgi:hypothetical protein
VSNDAQRHARAEMPMAGTPREDFVESANATGRAARREGGARRWRAATARPDAGTRARPRGSSRAERAGRAAPPRRCRGGKEEPEWRAPKVAATSPPGGAGGERRWVAGAVHSSTEGCPAFLDARPADHTERSTLTRAPSLARRSPSRVACLRPPSEVSRRHPLIPRNDPGPLPKSGRMETTL